MADEQQRIDDLLQRYLGLLDEYMRVRGLLSALQVRVYQNIARANFSAERGMRFGQDHYDDRMRATRLLSIVQHGDAHVPVFTVGGAVADDAAATVSGAAEDETQPENEEQEEQDKEEETEEHDEKAHTETPSTASGEQAPGKARDPLRWFGLLAPAALRQAQGHSVEMVEQLVPQLASIQAEMLTVEIEVRRARKRRAKGLASDGKPQAQVPRGAGAPKHQSIVEATRTEALDTSHEQRVGL